MTIIDGRRIAEHIYDGLRKLSPPKRFFAAIIVGDDSASASFVRQKEKAAQSIGVDFRTYRLSPALGNDGLRREVHRIADQKSCGGVIVQLPLPEGLSSRYVLNAIPPEKDIDVLSERSLGAFYGGHSSVLPPAVGAVEAVLSSEHIDIAGKSLAVVGVGALIGRPVANYFMRRAKEIYLLRRGSDFSLLARADIVVLGAGSPGLVKADMLKDGAGVIDFGYGTQQATSDKGQATRVSGDFDASNVNGQLSKVLFYTPTPGGTGPVLVACLLKNFYVLQGVKK